MAQNGLTQHAPDRRKSTAAGDARIVRPHSMNTPQVGKHHIACEFLSRAIELYLRGDSYFSAIHLAGAAEEVLSVIVRELPTQSGAPSQSTFDQMKELAVALSAPPTAEAAKQTEKWIHERMTDAKNSVKHMRGLKDAGIAFNAEEEARDIIDRTISTYIQLANRVALPIVSGIAEFDAERRSRLR